VPVTRPPEAAKDEPKESQLGPQRGKDIGRKTLVLDLDETLVHSSFRPTQSADIIITVELEGEDHKVYVRKRPGVDEFMEKVAQWYEVVIYTASMAKYANPLVDKLDPENLVSSRLFREACTRQPKGYVKDLSRLGRNLQHVIIIDNSPICYALQPDNAIPIKTWRDDVTDRELLDLIPILYALANVEDIPVVLQQIVWAADED
jgi:RNA polymerase II subunit A small phosphatase-like protein